MRQGSGLAEINRLKAFRYGNAGGVGRQPQSPRDAGMLSTRSSGPASGRRASATAGGVGAGAGKPSTLDGVDSNRDGGGGRRNRRRRREGGFDGPAAAGEGGGLNLYKNESVHLTREQKQVRAVDAVFRVLREQLASERSLYGQKLRDPLTVSERAARN